MSVERTGALVQNGVVFNVIVWGDESEAQYSDDGLEHFEEITDIDPKPRIGWTWSEEDGYRPPSPFPSWVFNGTFWEAPVKEPTKGGPFQWNEETTSWEPVPAE